MTSLTDLITAPAALAAEAAGGAVVAIGRHARGAGVVVAAGTVVTNAHNLRGSETTVTFPDGRRATATVAGVDADGDLAVLRVDTGAATPVDWSTAEPAVGAPVFAASLTAAGAARVTFGVVSATGQTFRGPGGRIVTGAVEHTAPLPSGSSGGPLLDASGQVVALNTHRLGDGFYLAVPATAELRARLDALGRGESPARRRLGVALAPAGAARRMRAAVGLEPRDGLLVRAVEAGSPADAAGVRSGDLVVAAGGTPVTGSDELFAALDAAGDTLSLDVVRGAEELSLTVSFAAAE